MLQYTGSHTPAPSLRAATAARQSRPDYPSIRSCWAVEALPFLRPEERQPLQCRSGRARQCCL